MKAKKIKNVVPILTFFKKGITIKSLESRCFIKGPQDEKFTEVKKSVAEEIQKEIENEENF